MNYAKIAVSVFLVTAGFAGRASAQVSPAGVTETDTSAAGKRADDLTHRGVAFGLKDCWTEAEPLLRQAWDLKHSYDIAGNLGIAEAALNKHRDAAEHLTFALHTFPANGKPEHRQLLEQTLARARLQVAAVTVRVNKDKADVSVDGKGVGISPLADTVFVDPGRRTIEAKLAGYDTASQVIEAKKGDASEVTLVLTAPAPPPPLPPKPPVESSSGVRTPVIITGAVLGGVGVIAGAVFAAMFQVKTNDATAMRDAIVQGGVTAGCGSSPSAQCLAIQSVMHDRVTFGNASVWSFIAGGTVGAGTVVYTLVAPRAAPTSGMRAVPLFMANGGGVGLQGEW